MTEIINVLEAFILWALAFVLVALAVKRRYPTRSVIVYGLVLTLGWVQLVGAVGGYLVSVDLQEGWLVPLPALIDMAALSRAAGLVLIFVLIVFELRYKPFPCPFQDNPESRCYLEKTRHLHRNL